MTVLVSSSHRCEPTFQDRKGRLSQQMHFLKWNRKTSLISLISVLIATL